MVKTLKEKLLAGEAIGSQFIHFAGPENFLYTVIDIQSSTQNKGITEIVAYEEQVGQMKLSLGYHLNDPYYPKVEAREGSE